MTTTQQRFLKRVSVLAVHAAVTAMAVIPNISRADREYGKDEVPTDSSIEVGIGNVGKSSAAFGEYNGLYKDGAYLIGNLELMGGGAKEGAFHWRLSGSNLGLDTRRIGAEVGTQGQYRFSFGYDELRREYTDSFKTLYRGFGSTTLTLPDSYPAAATRASTTTTTAGVLSNWANPQAPYATAACANTGGVPTVACQGPGYLIPALVYNPGNLATERKRTNVGLSYQFSPQIEFKASARREDKDGVKLTGFGVNGPGRGLFLPEPINSSTYQYEAGIAYVGKGTYLNVGYIGSTYVNDVNLWTAENPFQNNSMIGNIARLTGAPDNRMDQFNASGGYSFTPRTKLVLAGSYTRLTQNEDFHVSYPSVYLIPEESARAKVLNTTLSARLTSRPLANLSLNVAYRYDNRDNRTPSELFVVPAADNGNTNANGNTSFRTFVNDPYDRRSQRFNLDGDYALGNGDNIGIGYEWQDLKHSGHGLIPLPATSNRESSLRLDYRSSFSERWNGQLAFAHSERRIRGGYHEGNPLPLTPVIPEDVAALVAAGKVVYANGRYSYPTGSNYIFMAADPLMSGFRMFFVADRNRDKLRGSVNYQASESLALDAILDYSEDRYLNADYGLKRSKNLSLTLDGSYAASENLSFNAYYTYEDIEAKMNQQAILRGVVSNPEVVGAPASTVLIAANTATECVGSSLPIGTPNQYWLDPCRAWAMQQADRIDTVGMSLRAKGMFGGKFELVGDFVYSRAKSPISFTGGTYNSNGVRNVYYSAESPPDITNDMVELRIAGTYSLDKNAAVRVSYLGRRLHSADFQLDAYTNPTAFQSFLGTGMTSPDYTVHVLGVSYIYRFR